jgi:hypothetical protein
VKDVCGFFCPKDTHTTQAPCIPANAALTQEIVEEVRGKRLFFSTDVEKAVREAEIIFVSVNTPTKDYGFGKGLAADLTYWEGAARSISRACSPDVGLLNGTKIIVEKSTVPVHTADAMTCVLKANCPPGVSFQVRAVQTACPFAPLIHASCRVHASGQSSVRFLPFPCLTERFSVSAGSIKSRIPGRRYSHRGSDSARQGPYRRSTGMQDAWACSWACICGPAVSVSYSMHTLTHGTPCQQTVSHSSFHTGLLVC